MALEAADQLVSRAILPAITYEMVLVLFIGGIPASLIIGWYHGEKGDQAVSRRELMLLGGVGVGTLIAAFSVYEANQRPSTAAEIDSALNPRRVAVLYFDPGGGGEELTAIADGLTESLIGRLERVGPLNVVSRNGSRLFRGSDVARDSVARALEAGTLITGSVEPEDDQVRITTRLVDGSSGALVQRGTVRFPRQALLSGLDSVSVEISRHLRQWLGDEFDVKRERGETENLAAWTLLQRGEKLVRDANQLLHHHRGEQAFQTFSRADSLFAEAASLDTTWAEPVVGRARVAYEQSRALGHDLARAQQQIERGFRFANTALARTGNSARAYELRGSLRYWQSLLDLGEEGTPEQRLQTARRDLERAVELDPSLASAHSTLSHLYYRVGSITDAVLAAQRAYEEDSYLDVADGVLWRLYHGNFDLGNFQQARRWCQEGARRFPQDFRFTECKLWLMITPVEQPDVERAWQLQERAFELAPQNRKPYERALGRIIVGGVLARAELPDSARSVLRRTRESVGQETDPTRDLLAFEAVMRTMLGEQDEAIQLLKRYQTANPDHSFQRGEEIAWWWRDLRDHPEFDELLSGH